MSAGDLLESASGAWQGFPAMSLASLASAVLLLILSLWFSPRVQMLAGIFLLFAIANAVPCA
jgi:hypothetical protein